MTLFGKVSTLFAVVLLEVVSLRCDVVRAADASAIHLMRGTLVDIPVLKVFIPAHGFDDNDPVQAVVSGELPNPCYSVYGPSVARSQDGKTFELRQTAWREMNGPCGSGDLVDDPVPFSNEILLGRLNATQYQIAYQTRETGRVKRGFGVEESSLSATDNFDYAVVQAIEMDSLQTSGKSLAATIAGVFTTSCTDFVRPLKVERIDDVVVVLPVIKASGADCARASVPFREVVEIGAFDPGSYLLHVRSRNGKAVNRLFEAKAP
jgi:hypothetical protein